MKKLGFYLFLLLFIGSAPYLSATDYYVDSYSGNDSDNGLSTGAAWRTISKVNSSMSLFQAGDRILFKRGETWIDTTLNITRGGNNGSYITFGAYGSGNRPKLDCGIRNISHGILITYSNVNYVLIENFEVCNASCGIGAVSNPRTNIIVRDCYLHHMSGNGIIFREINGYEISGCLVHDCSNSGIGMIGTPSNPISNGKIMNNTCYNFGTNDAISIHRSDEGDECGPNHYFYNNTCYNAAEDGLDITSGTYIILRDNRTYNNEGKSCLIGTVVPADRYVWIENHYSRNENKRGIYFGGNKKITMIHSICWNPAQRVFHYGGSAGCDDVHIYNNTFIYDNRSELAVVADTGADNNNLTFKNNIIMSNDYDPDVYLVYYSGGNSPANTNSIWDNNCHWHVDGNENARRWTDSVRGAQTWSAWRSNYGVETHGMFSNPRLSNISAENFSLQSNSPCIDAGTWVATITSAPGSGRSFQVSNATPFHNGRGLTTGSVIQLEGKASTVRVTSVNYNTHTLTVNTTVSWAYGDGVAFSYKGARPDIGAVELDGEAPLNTEAGASPQSGEAPVTVQFSAEAWGGNSPYTYHWTFGDGDSSSQQNPSHTYTQPGNYTARLTVTDEDNDQQSDSVSISVNAVQPLSAGIIASPTSGQAALAVFFTGTASGGTTPYTYSWSFGDGGSSTQQNPSHTYSQPGNYTARFTVTDNNGSQDSATIGISVSTPTPQLSASAGASPLSGTAPLVVSFTGTASGGTSPYTYSWSFGDGSSSTQQNPSHTYSQPGSYTARFTVTDNNGTQDSITIGISVSAPTPQLSASAGASPLSGIAPLVVSFTGTASGGTSPYTYSWSFGDGSSSTQQNPSHTYSQPGVYTATFSVTDSTDQQSSVSISINVGTPIVEVKLNLSISLGQPALGQPGTITPSSGSHTYLSGSRVQLRAIPNENYRFSRWLGNIWAENAGYSDLTITLAENRQMTALFCSMCGDVNGDLRLSPLDSQAVFDIFLGKINNPTICQKENGDVTGDGTRAEPYISPADAQAIFVKYLNKSDLPCDCSYNIRTASFSSFTEVGKTTVLQKPMQDIHLGLADLIRISETEVQVPVMINNPLNVDAFGFDLAYPEDSLEFTGVAKTEMVKDFYQVEGNKIGEGMLRVGGYSIESIIDESAGELVLLIFKLKKKGVNDSHELYIAQTYDDVEHAYYTHRAGAPEPKKETKYVRR